MTYRELRKVLFNIENQNLTVKDLRKILFEEEQQDKEINLNELLQVNGCNGSVII